MQRARGFTLIELVIVMAIASIVAAMALPAYTDHVMRSRATAAASVLKDLRLNMERRYADDRSYATAAGACPIANFVDRDSGFSFSCATVAGGQSYTWTGTGTAGTAGITYTIDEAGIERTLALPSRWSAGVTLPVTRFVLRRGG